MGIIMMGMMVTVMIVWMYVVLNGHFKHISMHRDAHHVLEFLYSNEGMISVIVSG